MRIKRLDIKVFRHLEDISMEFGERITAIAGQNCTGKSSMLGVIGHIFTYTRTEEMKKQKTLSNKPFETVFSEIFKFSYPEFDKPKQHIYSISLDNEESIPVVSYDRVEKGETKDLRLRVRKSTAGEGKIIHPVIFLGLRRLFPLAQEEKITHNTALKLTKEETEQYQVFHNEVLYMAENIDPDLIEVHNKIYFGVKTKKHDPLGSSAGQDNIGQIITALLSFKRLKEQLKEQYSGGLILIDEIDATLYPGAQIKLIEKLFRWAQDLDLQIVFTTHSLEIIRTLFSDKYKYHSKVIYLSKFSGKVKNYQIEADIKRITNDLLVLPPEKEAYPKIPVFCEDEEARLWLANLLETSNKRKIHILKENFGGDELIHWAKKKVKFFQKSIFVVDGDKRKEISKKSKCPRIICLPDNDAPERIFYKYLKSEKCNDLWDKNLGGFNSQNCFGNQNQISDDREKMKKWFTSQKKYLGRGYSKLFNKWQNDYQIEVKEFNENFSKIIKQIEGA